MFRDVAKVLPRLLFAPRAFSSYSAARGTSGCHHLLRDGALNIHHPAKEPSAPFRVRGEELIALTLQSYPQQIWVARALGKFLIIRFLHLCTTTWWFLAIKSNGQHWITPKTSLTQNTKCSSVQYINNSKKKINHHSYLKPQGQQNHLPAARPLCRLHHLKRVKVPASDSLLVTKMYVKRAKTTTKWEVIPVQVGNAGQGRADSIRLCYISKLLL